MIIEFIGLPGSGKSTLLETTKNTWSEVGLQAMNVPEAGVVCLKRMFLGRLICSTMPVLQQQWALYGIFRRFIQLYRIKFILKNRKLAGRVLMLLLQRPISWPDKRSVLRWFFRDVSYYEFFQTYLKDDEVLLLDEGLVHRATSLYALPFVQPDPAQLRQYIEALPPKGLVIWVQTSLDVSIERVISRGIAKRYWGKELRPFMQNSLQVIEMAIQNIKKRDWQVISVNNDNSPEESAAQLRLNLTLLREKLSL